MNVGTLQSVLQAFAIVVMAYWALWTIAHVGMGVDAAVYLWRHRRRNTVRARTLVDRLETLPAVSVLVPAYNEALTIADSVHALRALDYRPMEIVVVNDGSTDDTLRVVRETFGLLPAPLAFDQRLKTQGIRGVYRSLSEPPIVAIDKENGGFKADALNAAINVASGTLILAVDADTVLASDALDRAVLPFLEQPETVAVGGHVAIANGCRIENGQLTDVALPASWLARFQIIEYMRAFLLFRLASAMRNGVVLISGAFGLFRRDAVIAVGGYDTTAIGEDMDLTVRLQRYGRAQRSPTRITFDPNPLAWTQAPEDWRSLRAQRRRWRRGLLQVLWRHRWLIGNPRYRMVGLIVFPSVAVLDGIGPLLELSGYGITAAAAAAGLLQWRYFWMLLAASVLFGVSVTMLSLLLSDVATRRYESPRDMARMVAVALLENVGYRQLNAWWNCEGTIQALAGTRGWGKVRRRTFTTTDGRPDQTAA